MMILMMIKIMMMFVINKSTVLSGQVVKKELRDLTVEHELRLQAFQKRSQRADASRSFLQLQEERNELLKRKRESILDIQQRSGLKKILLQKKLAAVTETLEKKETQLCAAWSVCSIEPTVRSNAVSKLEQTRDLECQVSVSPAAQLPVSAAQLVTSCMFDLQEYEAAAAQLEEQLKASGGSLHDFPFRPAKKILKDAGSDQ
ncbi:hypothetical protein CRENBAI_007510 [Crenichthys baileyi]|uniref:Dynein regulatory complex subunit 4 n=1 Tax=Crenichthys baileyi TaxID=28760 RepID=A0AAV9QVN2_9TELE